MSRPPIYCAVHLETSDVLDMISRLPPEIFEGKRLQPGFHCTVKYFGNRVDREWHDRHLAKLGKKETVHIVGVAFDDRCVAAIVERTFPCDNLHPHVTLALRSGTPAVYSNSLLSGDQASVVACDSTLVGTNVFA